MFSRWYDLEYSLSVSLNSDTEYINDKDQTTLSFLNYHLHVTLDTLPYPSRMEIFPVHVINNIFDVFVKELSSSSLKLINNYN